MLAENLKILAIDDNRDNLTTLKAVIADIFPGATILTALNGWKGIELALAEDPDVILLDIIMPGMDGYEVCRKLKEDERLRLIPVVFLTALKTGRQSRIQALEAGGEAFLSKPFEEEELIAQVRSMAKIKAMNMLQRREKEELAAQVADRTRELELELAERQKAEQELREAHQELLKSEADLKKAQKVAHVGSWVWHIPSNQLEWSDQMFRIFGVDKNDFKGDLSEVIASAIHPDDRKAVEQSNLSVIEDKKAIPLEYRILWPDGTVRVVWAEAGELIVDESGSPIVLTGIVQDITERKQYERELEALVTVTAALRAAASRAEMLPAILDQLLSLLDVEGAMMTTIDKTSGDLLIELGQGVWSGASGRLIQHSSGLSQEVLATGQPFLDDLSQSGPHLFGLELFGECRFVAGVPLVVQDEKIGLLWIASQRRITEHDQRLVIAIADIAASAIHRAALYEQTEDRLRQLTAQRTIDQAIIDSFDLNITLNTLVDQVANQLKVDAVAVLLYDPHTLTLEYASGCGFRNQDIENTRLRLGEGRAGLAALEQSTQSTPNLAIQDNGLSRAPLFAREGFISHYVTPLVAKGQLKGVLEVFHRTRLDPAPEWLGYLETFANQAAIAIADVQLFNGLQRSNLNLSLAYEATIEGWSRAMDLRDHETEGHTQRVTDLTVRLARIMGINDEQIVHIRRGALLHDIGKLGIPDTVLLKPGTLSPEEWDLMRKHPQYAYEMLYPIEYLHPALEIPYCHHEKWDGTGYPRQLKGEEIPFAARLFAVVDVFDALTSNRPYRNAWTQEKALGYYREQQGKHFDPNVVEAFLSFYNK